MAIAHVQAATPVNENAPDAPTGPAITLTGVAAGNEIVVWGSWNGNFTPTCADDKDNSYVLQKRLYDTGNNQGLVGFAAKVVTGGTVVITVSWGGDAGYRTVFAEEKSGVNTTTDIDVTSVGQYQETPGTGTDGLSSTAFTTVTNDCMICACSVNIADANIPAVGSVGTSRSSNAAGAAMRSEDWAAGTAGSKTSNFTALSDVKHHTIQMALRPAATSTAALTGTAAASITETDIRAGGKTIILTLTGDTYVAAGTTFDNQRQAIINGLDSAQAGANGWDAEVKAKIPVTDVARTSGTVCTITLTAETGYSISAPETITATIPGAALTGTNPIVATPTFSVTQGAGPAAVAVDLTGRIGVLGVQLIPGSMIAGT